MKSKFIKSVMILIAFAMMMIINADSANAEYKTQYKVIPLNEKVYYDEADYYERMKRENEEVYYEEDDYDNDDEIDYSYFYANYWDDIEGEDEDVVVAFGFFYDIRDEQFSEGYVYNFEVNQTGNFSVVFPEQYLPKKVILRNIDQDFSKIMKVRSDGTMNDNKFYNCVLTPGKYVLGISGSFENTGTEYFYTEFLPDNNTVCEKELNNNFSTANGIMVNTEVKGFSGLTEDYFWFTITENGILDVTGTCSYSLYSESSDGNTKLLQNGKQNVSAGKYYLMVDPEKDFYTFKVSFETNDGSWEKESNDTMSEANDLSMGKSLKGNIQTAKDYDYYKVNITEDIVMGKVTLLIPKGIHETAYAVDINRFDENSNKLVNIGKIVSTPNPANYSPVIPFVKGTYYIIVNSKSGRANSSDEYEIKVDPVPKEEGRVSNVVATKNNKNLITLNWNTFVGADGYMIYKIVDGEKQLVEVVDSKTTKYTEYADSLGRKNSYCVNAYFKVGENQVESYDSLKAVVDIPTLPRPTMLVKKTGSRVYEIQAYNYGMGKKIEIFARGNSKKWDKTYEFNAAKRQSLIFSNCKKIKFRSYVKIGNKKMYSKFTKAFKL